MISVLIMFGCCAIPTAGLTIFLVGGGGGYPDITPTLDPEYTPAVEYYGEATIEITPSPTATNTPMPTPRATRTFLPTLPPRTARPTNTPRPANTQRIVITTGTLPIPTQTPYPTYTP